MARDRHDGSGWMFVALGLLAVAMFSALGSASQHMGPASIPLWFAAIGGTGWILRGSLGQAIAERISGRVSNEQSELSEQVYAELDELRARVAELEERVDFSERVLARSGDGHASDGGS